MAWGVGLYTFVNKKVRQALNRIFDYPTFLAIINNVLTPPQT